MRARALALSIGGIDVIAKLVIYVVHERAWIWVDRRNARRARERTAMPVK
ncbi:MAG: DUF2061 domain-containing protein [Polyangiaceae bacterium]